MTNCVLITISLSFRNW